MRNLKNRPGILDSAEKRLANLSTSLMATPNPSEACETRFNTARDTKWFQTAIRATLVDMAGSSRTCMFCDHNEPTDVEHFKPKTVFPIDTFSWNNMLWVCTTCNRLKGNRFPPHNCTGAVIIDPVAEPIWEFFFLDEFGNLIKRWNVELNAYDARAQSTCDYAHVDREEVQTRRQKRMKNLLSLVRHAISDFGTGTVTMDILNSLVVDWLGEPFQADVADYYLRGPGNISTPFSELIALGVTIPPP